MFKDAVAAEQAERDQEADCARIDAAIRSSEEEIAALADRQLDPIALRREWSEIRDRTIACIRDVRHNVVDRANEAKATEQWMIEKFLSESDGKAVNEFSVMLNEVPTKGLVDYLHYLVRIGDRDRVQSVCEVFAARKDRQAYGVTFSRMLVQLALSDCADLQERLGRICRSADRVDARVTELFVSDPASGAGRQAMPS
jgi:hypothetical protein